MAQEMVSLKVKYINKIYMDINPSENLMQIEWLKIVFQ